MFLLFICQSVEMQLMNNLTSENDVINPCTNERSPVLLAHMDELSVAVLFHGICEVKRESIKTKIV